MTDLSLTTVEQHEAALLELDRQIAATKGRLRSIGKVAQESSAIHRQELRGGLSVNLKTLAEASGFAYDVAHQAWLSDRFAGWEVSATDSPGDVRVASFREKASGEVLPVSWLFPLVGGGRTIIIKSRGDEQYRRGLGLLQSLIVRTAVMFPQQVRYTLLDPAGNGLAFPMARYLPRVTPPSGDVRRDLDGVIQEITRIVSTYLDAGTTSFEQIPDEMRLNEAYHFVAVADFPNRYDLRAAEALQNIAETGSRAGVYVFVHLNEDRWQQATSGFDRYLPNNSVVIDMNDLSVTAEGIAGTLEVDEAPSAQLQEFLFNKIKAAPPLDRPIPWDDLVDTSPESIWSESSDDLITATVGRHGANQPLQVWFGYRDREMRPCVHGVVGAMSGAGKSTFFHNLVNSLAVRYSPAELRLYLIDGKFGVEFEPYRHLPHAEVVSLKTSPDLSRSVLAELTEEMAKRNAIFQRTGVVDITSYRRSGAPEGLMPRILLVVDEYQQLFDGDKDGEASQLLKRISEQGRSAGIHMLLASQRFDSAGMLDRDAIFNNIHLRIAMQLAQSEVAALTEFGPKGRRLISATCDRVGRVVINDRAGDDDTNTPGKTALLSSERRDGIVEMLRERAAHLDPSALPRRVVFNGQAQPDLVDNPLLQILLAGDRWRSAEELEDFARRPIEVGGLGIDDWLVAERPVVLYLGQEFNVRGHAATVLRRRPNENLLIVGDRHQERVAMLVSSIMSACLSGSPNDTELLVGDRSVPRTAWADTLEQTTDAVRSLGFPVQFARDESGIEQLIDRAVEVLTQRQSLRESDRIDERTILLVISEPDRLASLLRVPDDYGAVDSERGQLLRKVITQGPSLGIHVILSSASLGVLKSVVGEKVIQSEFRHRVAMQMSEDDSFLFVRSNRASRLQIDGERPISALLFDNQRQAEERFKPYSIDASPGSSSALHEQVRSLVADLQRRGAGA